MKAKIKIINEEKYVPVNIKTAKILQKSDVELYRINNSKTLYIKVNYKGE